MIEMVKNTKIDIDGSIIYDTITGETIADVEDISDTIMIRNIIAYLIRENDKKDFKIKEIEKELMITTEEVESINEEKENLQYEYNELESEFQMFKDSLDEWEIDYER